MVERKGDVPVPIYGEAAGPYVHETPAIYEFDECDEMTLCALAVLLETRKRIMSAWAAGEAAAGFDEGYAAGVAEAVRTVDAYAQEIVDRERENNDL